MHNEANVLASKPRLYPGHFEITTFICIYNNEVYVKGLTSNEFEIEYYKTLEEVTELQYYNK